MYSDYDDYCEPSDEEIFLNEIKDKFKEILHEDVKAELEKLRKENADLNEVVKECTKEKNALKMKERELRFKEDDLKREVEREFYNKSIIEVFENFMEDAEVWYAECVPHEKPKCNLCNKKRELIATYPNGQKTKKECDCAEPDYYYEPVVSMNKMVKFHKAYKPRYGSERKMYFRTSYRPNKEFAEAYDCYGEFEIESIFDKFDESAKAYHNEKRYSENLGFRDREECQKYCNWLNEKE